VSFDTKGGNWNFAATAKLKCSQSEADIEVRVMGYLSQARETLREYVDGETHYFDGQRYLLSVVNSKQAASVVVAGNGRIELHCHADASHSKKQKAFDGFYRKHLIEILEKALPKWCEALNVDRPEIRIQRMRTKWGSCNPKNGRIMINLEFS
jgi:predicted metal-dependent hydrolase